MLTETVTVYLPTESGTDSMGEPLRTFDSGTPVPGVLVYYTTEDDRERVRPDGIQITCRMEFPKTYQDDLRGAKIQVRDDTLYVSGAPRHTIQSELPWDMDVWAGVKDG